MADPYLALKVKLLTIIESSPQQLYGHPFLVSTAKLEF